MSRPKSQAPPKRRSATRSTPPVRQSPLANANLRLIWREQRISRAEIARHTGLSRSTVSETVDALIPTGLISEVGVGGKCIDRRSSGVEIWR